MSQENNSPRPTFETQSYVGSDIWQFSADGERPPRSAKLVAVVDYNGYMFARYWLSTTRERDSWVLWATTEDVDLGKMYATMAWGQPYRGIPARRAAEELLRQLWLDEISAYEYCGPCMSVDAEGLLTENDIRRIEGSLPFDAKDPPSK